MVAATRDMAERYRAEEARDGSFDGAWVSSTLDAERTGRLALAVLVAGLIAQVAVGASAGHATWGLLVAAVCATGTVAARSAGERLTARWVGVMTTVHLAAVLLGATS